MVGFTQAWIHLLHGVDLWVENEYGGGLYIAHPTGSVIAARKIGETCSIIANVTIGMRNEWGFLVIGAGARVLG
jgi:serine O-acetyltransferase